jgi:hypothetical protein
MKKFCVWLGDGSKEIIRGNRALVTKSKSGLQIKIGNRTIKDAVGFTEVCEAIKIP